MIARRRVPPRPRRSDRYTRRLLAALLELYPRLRTPQPIDHLLDALLDTALRCVPGAQKGSLLVLDGDWLAYRAAQGYDLESLRRVRIPAAPAVAEILQGRRAVQLRGFAEWDAQRLDPASLSILLKYGHIEQIRRSLVTSILVGGQFFGTLVLDNLRDQKPFPPEATVIAQVFADQAGAVIEQALLLERLRQSDTMLVEAEKLGSLGRFIANIAHEINNPLTAVLGYADLLDTLPLDSEAQAMLAQLRVGAERVRSIVRGLQLFARQQKSGESQVNLNLLVEQTVMLKQADLNLDQIDLALCFDPDLPFSWADGGQLSQVLLNLIVNAQHALRQTPLPRRLAIATEQVSGHEGSRLLLRVSDNGPGISPALARRIFEPFFTTRPAGQGTGLGLSICRGIVDAHGGRITVESRPGEGATFSVDLPLRVMPSGQVPPPRAPVAIPPPPRGRTILIVEDDPSVVAFVVHSLNADNTLFVAASGREGLRLLSVYPFDTALCDLRMPAMDGIAFFEAVRAEYPELSRRLIFMSGDTGSFSTSTALAATGRPLLTKPFTQDELFTALAAL